MLMQLHVTATGLSRSAEFFIEKARLFNKWVDVTSTKSSSQLQDLILEVKRKLPFIIHICVYQVGGNLSQIAPRLPLHPIGVISDPFERMLIDCVGLLLKTKKGDQYLFIIIDTATGTLKLIFIEYFCQSHREMLSSFLHLI